MWCLSVPLVAATIYNTWHLWPNLLILALLAGLTILGSGVYLIAHTMEIVPAVRRKALIADTLAVGSLVISIGLHVAAGRDVETASSYRAEQQENQERANRFQEEAARRQKELLQAEAARDQAAYKRTLAEIERAKRTGGALPPPRPVRPAGSVVLEGAAPRIGEITASPNARKDSWYYYVLAAFLVELLTAVFGPVAVYHERTCDRDGNGIPDFIEKLWEMVPDRVRREYPYYVKKLEDRDRGATKFVEAMEAPKA